MGATNAMLAYQLYAGRIPPLSMQLLAFMALVSRDDDTRPWYGQGHEALALFALGRPAPATESDLRAVRRAIEPLLSIGAIEADRRAAVRRDGPSTVRYRLRLTDYMPQEIDAPPVDNPPAVLDGPDARRTVSDPDVGRFPVARRTVSDLTQDENRPTEEPRGTTRSEIEEEDLATESTSLPSTPGPAANHDSTPDDGPDDCPRCGVVLDPDGRCRNRQCRDPTLAAVIPLTRPA